MSKISDRIRLLRQEGTIKRIHVDKRMIRMNNKSDGKVKLPPITIQTSQGSLKVHKCEIQGPSTMIYLPDNPLSCGAKVWLETTAAVEAIT